MIGKDVSQIIKDGLGYSGQLTVNVDCIEFKNDCVFLILILSSKNGCLYYNTMSYSDGLYDIAMVKEESWR